MSLAPPSWSEAPSRSEPAGRSEARGRSTRSGSRAIRPINLGGVTLPATAAAALSLLATGAGVAGSLGGTAAAEGRTPLQPEGSTLTLGQVRDVHDTAADAVQVVEAQRTANQLRASRDLSRAKLLDEEKAKLAVERRWVLPVRHYVLTSGFGMRWGALHAGEDFAAPIGTPVHAISTGTIVFAGVESGYGNKIEIRHWDGTCSWYGHLSKIDVKVGQKVNSGQLIGLVGDTGHSTGPHLHLEIHPHGGKPIDPLPWLRAHGLKP